MEEINSTINSSASTVGPVPSVTESHSSFKIPWVAVFVVGMMVLSSLVTYLILKSPAPVKNPASVVQSSPAVVVQPTPTPDPTANWKTYTSIKANYSFKYPVEWPLVNVPISPQCTVCVENLVFTPQYNANTGDNNLAVILIFKEDRIKTLEDYVSVHVNGDSSKINLKYVTVGGEKAVSYTLSGGIPPLPVIEYAVVKNGMYYTIRLEDGTETNKNKDKNLSTFDQILSTFKFLE